MNTILTVILAMILSTASISYAQTPVGEASVDGHKKKAEKNVKTNGKVSTSGCETASGKTLAENDFGYADCIKQIGLKKKDKVN